VAAAAAVVEALHAALLHLLAVAVELGCMGKAVLELVVLLVCMALAEAADRAAVVVVF
tara:strand:+ start:1515 stop:1688 length:174 start_codon:yes stop_codon:yes gene_type:complete